MKRAVASVGAFAVGVAGLHGQNVTGLSPQETSKWWLLSAQLNSFYDDNTLNQTDEFAEGSFGFQFSPKITANFPLSRTLLSTYYRASIDYYEARPDNNIDQTHEFSARANHRFSERSEIDFDESFLYFDSPQVSGNSSDVSTLRSDASGFRNDLSLNYSRRLTPVAGIYVGYQNTLRDYIDDGSAVFNGLGILTKPAGLSAALDSTVHKFSFDGRWYMSSQTMYFVGYALGIDLYTSKDVFDKRLVRIGTRDELVDVLPDEKNARSHTFYVGAKREFNRKLSGEGSIGVNLSEYYNNFPDPLLEVTPFADLSGTYAYNPRSSVKLGLNVYRTPTDFAYDRGQLTRDQLTTAFTATVNHQITSRITGAMTGRYQHSIYNGGSLDGQADDYLSFQIGADYKIRENLFASAAYSFNNLSSSRSGLDYSRNRVSMGVRIVY